MSNLVVGVGSLKGRVTRAALLKDGAALAPLLFSPLTNVDRTSAKQVLKCALEKAAA